MLDDMIDRFVAMIGRAQVSPGATTGPALLTALTLAHAATIRLHENLQGLGPLTHRKDVLAAITASSTLSDFAPEQLPFMNPIMTVRNKHWT